MNDLRTVGRTTEFFSRPNSEYSQPVYGTLICFGPLRLLFPSVELLRRRIIAGVTSKPAVFRPELKAEPSQQTFDLPPHFLARFQDLYHPEIALQKGEDDLC